MKINEWPERGDTVIVKIKSITPYGAIVDLLEYHGVEGFVHISQVTTAWVKNIRSFLSEGQTKVGLVKRMDREKNTIDISLKDVSKQQEKRKNEDYRREKKADHLFEIICKQNKIAFKEAYDEIALVLEQEFGDLYSAFEAAATDEEEFSKTKIPDKWKKDITEQAKKAIQIQNVTVSGELDLQTKAGNGVEVIKEALSHAKPPVQITYISAPKYKIKVTAPNYEKAEKTMRKTAESIIQFMKKNHGEGSFEKEKA